MHLFSTPLKTENRKGFSELVFQANFVYREGDMPKNFASPNLQARKVVTYLDLLKARTSKSALVTRTWDIQILR